MGEACVDRPTWEADWMDEIFGRCGKQMIFKLILAANYMTIQPLLDLGCMKIATMIKGKSPEEIKRILGDNDEAGNDEAGNVKVLSQDDEKDAQDQPRARGANDNRRLLDMLSA